MQLHEIKLSKMTHKATVIVFYHQNSTFWTDSFRVLSASCGRIDSQLDSGQANILGWTPD